MTTLPQMTTEEFRSGVRTLTEPTEILHYKDVIGLWIPKAAIAETDLLTRPTFFNRDELVEELRERLVDTRKRIGELHREIRGLEEMVEVLGHAIRVIELYYDAVEF